MKSHYLSTSRSNPQLYTFSQLFEPSGFVDLQPEWKEQVQQTAWLEFWEREGYELLEVNWHRRHPDYKQAIEVASVEERASWQKLWEEHASDQTADFWHIFSCVLDNYERDLTNGLQGVEQDVKEIDENFAHLDIERSESSDSEQQQLRLLGLPTSFGVQTERIKHTSKRQPASESESDNDFNSLNMAKDKNDILHAVQTRTIKKTKNKRKNKSKIPQFMREETHLLKYWLKRFSLFSRFDQGIRLDRESWYSVTPEKIAKHTAQRLACDVIVDAFCGCGGNAIQFANTCGRVIAIDIDADKLAMAKHNAGIYGVAHKIDFVHADFLQFASSTSLRPDVVFLSPPWGGPDYQKEANFDIEQCLLPLGATQLMQHARRLTNNIGFFLPRNSNVLQMIALTQPNLQCEMVYNYLNVRLVAITAYYGDGLVGSKN